MAQLFPLQFDRLRVAAKAAAFGVVLANAGIAAPDAKPIPPPPGLVSWWLGDRNARDIIDDNDGLLKGGASFRNGLVKNAFSLDGIDDFVLVPDSSSLRFGTNDFTIDVWANFRTTEGEQVIIEKWIQKFDPVESTEGWSLTKREDNSVVFATIGGDVELPRDAILPNTWYFFAISRAGDDYAIYLNGVAVQSESFSFNLDSCAALKFGHRCNPEDTPGCEDDRGFFLNGLIDEVEIFNRALSEDEILDIFEAGSAGKIKPRRHD